MRGLWAQPNGRVLLLAGALVLAFLPINFLLLQAFGWSAYWPTRNWLLGDLNSLSDSWRVMILAYEWTKAHPGEGLYQAIFFEQQTRFQYAPTSMLPLAALDVLGVELNPALFDGFNRLLIGVSAAGMGAFAWLLMGRMTPAGHDAPLMRPLAAGLAGIATLLFYPVMMAFHLGQVQVWINALFVFASIAWLVERKALAGVLIGLICLLKPQFALFALWAPLRREWGFCAGLIATGAVGGLLSLALFGWANHFEYLGVLQFLSRHGESYWANQSVNGLLHRLLGHGVGANWDPNVFPAFDPLVYVVTLATSVAILAAAFLVKRGSSAMAGLFDFQLAALAFTIASPVAWEHHYGVLAAMFALLFISILAETELRTRRRWLIGLALIFAFSANCWTFVRLWSASPFNLAQSHLFFAGLALLALLRWRAGAKVRGHG